MALFAKTNVSLAKFFARLRREECVFHNLQNNMANRNDLRWQNNYEALKAYIEEHHYLPDKRKVENRKLVNWWKYNRRRIRLGKIDPERARKLEELSNMRWL